MHCGWINRREHTEHAELPERIGDVRVRELGLCPGYLVRLRAVGQCMQAKVAMEAGVLSDFFPEREAAVLDGAMLATQAFNAHEVERIREAAK